MRYNPENEVDELLRNAQLRDELEPYLDESVEVVNLQFMTTQLENEFLASMLDWERAPVLPISRWFRPELRLPPVEQLSDAALRQLLADTIHKLYRRRIALDFTDHLSDRELYCLIRRDILPSPEKKTMRRNAFLHWQCIDPEDEPDVWLRFYATQEEREIWALETGRELPPSETPPFPRKMPRGLL
jgi:hypothetical protein